MVSLPTRLHAVRRKESDINITNNLLTYVLAHAVDPAVVICHDNDLDEPIFRTYNCVSVSHVRYIKGYREADLCVIPVKKAGTQRLYPL